LLRAIKDEAKDSAQQGKEADEDDPTGSEIQASPYHKSFSETGKSDERMRISRSS